MHKKFLRTFLIGGWFLVLSVVPSSPNECYACCGEHCRTMRVCGRENFGEYMVGVVRRYDFGPAMSKHLERTFERTGLPYMHDRNESGDIKFKLAGLYDDVLRREMSEFSRALKRYERRALWKALGENSSKGLTKDAVRNLRAPVRARLDELLDKLFVIGTNTNSVDDAVLSVIKKGWPSSSKQPRRFPISLASSGIEGEDPGCCRSKYSCSYLRAPSVNDMRNLISSVGREDKLGIAFHGTWHSWVLARLRQLDPDFDWSLSGPREFKDRLSDFARGRYDRWLGAMTRNDRRACVDFVSGFGKHKRIVLKRYLNLPESTQRKVTAYLDDVITSTMRVDTLSDALAQLKASLPNLKNEAAREYKDALAWEKEAPARARDAALKRERDAENEKLRRYGLQDRPDRSAALGEIRRHEEMMEQQLSFQNEALRVLRNIH